MKAVIYARVSSKEQEETGYSLPAQIKLLEDYAVKKELKIAKIFSVPESASGSKERKVFDEMIEYLSKNDIPNLLCEKVDRLTRNLKDAVTINEWVEKDSKRRIHFVKQNLIIHKNARSDEKFRWDIEIVLAKKYIANLSEEVKKGLNEKLRQGWLPTKPPPGYKTIGERGHKIHIIDENTAPLVKKMFETYITGNYSLKRLVEFCHASGLRNSNGRKIFKSRIAELLADPFYIGKIRYNGAVHPGKHKPIISEEVFSATQQVLRQKCTPKYRKHFPLFKALIKCEECGGSVTWEVQKGHWYGHCNHYRNCTQRKFVRQESLEEQILPYFEKITIKSQRLVEWIKKALKESHQNEMAYNLNAREELNRRYEATQKRLEILYDDKLDGKITEEFYNRKFTQYAKEKDEILAAIKRHDIATIKYYELGSDIIDLGRRAKEIYLNEKRTVEERRSLLNLIFSNLTLKDSKIAASYSKAFGILADYAPAWNKKFEPTQKATKSGFLCDAAVTTPDEELMGSLEPRKDFRTSRNPHPKPRFAHTTPESGLLLRRQDSNLRPRDYI